MPTLADLLSVETDLELDGKTYKVRPPTLLEQGRFQRWLEQRAREAIDRAVYKDEASRDRCHNLITQDVAAGVYEWGGELCVKALQTEAGVVRLLELVAGVPAAEAKRLVDSHLKKI